LSDPWLCAPRLTTGLPFSRKGLPVPKIFARKVPRWADSSQSAVTSCDSGLSRATDGRESGEECHLISYEDNTPCESVIGLLKTLRFHRFVRAHRILRDRGHFVDGRTAIRALSNGRCAMRKAAASRRSNRPDLPQHGQHLLV